MSIDKIVTFVKENPGKAACYTVAATTMVVAAAPTIVASPALAVAGFAADGVVKGSIAAGVQSGIGNVAAGSLFATLQSAGAGGYGMAAVASGVSTASSVTSALATGVAAWLGRRGKPKDDDDEEGEGEDKKKKGKGKDKKDKDEFDDEDYDDEKEKDDDTDSDSETTLVGV